MVLLFIITYYLFSANIKPPSIALALALPGVGNVHLKVKIKPLLSRFHHYNIQASLDKKALRNSVVRQKNISGPLIIGQDTIMLDYHWSVTIMLDHHWPGHAYYRSYLTLYCTEDFANLF